MKTVDDLESTLLRHPPPVISAASRRLRPAVAATAALLTLALLAAVIAVLRLGGGGDLSRWGSSGGPDEIESDIGVVAADDGRCSEIGVRMMKAGGHAVDAAVAAALCLGVVHPMSSGIGGGNFMIVRPSGGGASAEAYDARETAPLAASKNMYEHNPSSKARGALSMGVPGELAGLHAAWSKHGRLPWKALFRPAIVLARDGFVVERLLARSLVTCEDIIISDPGLQKVYAPNGKILRANDTCHNHKLADTLETISTEGIQAFYNGSIGEKFIEDVKNAGGIVTMEDLRTYKVEVEEALKSSAFGYTILGMPPPSSGTAGLSLVLNILDSYKKPDAVEGLLGLHRFIEALKHMYAIRMNLGDPDFVNDAKYVEEMLSPAFAEELQKKIRDNTTFGPDYYMARWSQLRDHGTSHLCVVDADRNAVSITTTVNYYYGAGLLSPSTGIVVNNEMDDFSIPTEVTPDKLPPAPANFIEPRKRPLSSMTPLIVLKGNQLAGAIGASGGINIIPAVAQVFLNHFVLEMQPLEAVLHPRVYHTLIPNTVQYENSTAIDGEHIELSEDAIEFLKRRGHHLESISFPAICQFVVHNLNQPVHGEEVERADNDVFHGTLTAVSDPRKDGQPSGI